MLHGEGGITAIYNVANFDNNIYIINGAQQTSAFHDRLGLQAMILH